MAVMAKHCARTEYDQLDYKQVMVYQKQGEIEQKQTGGDEVATQCNISC